MSLLNYTSPFLATPSPPPPTVNFFQPQPQPPYSYPTPQKPFLREDFAAALHQQTRQPPPPTQYHSPFNQQQQNHPPPLPPTYTKVNENVGIKTSIHPIIDYDYDEDEEDVGGGGLPIQQHVTPIQGPIYIKNGSVPVVPLYSHPVLNNGTFVQIPILWTALSVALGIELHGEYIRGVPCIKRHQQLFCPTAGNSYPLDRIELFIDENKALMKRMYGEFDMIPPDVAPNNSKKRRRSISEPNDSYFGKLRVARQAFRNNQSSETGRVDACESKVEIMTPYWASNSAGKIRAIVNTQHFEQAIHQEVCAKVRTNRCREDCGCEQKYKWHRLLAYDPDNDCKGIFMDWFLFPSCCVCRCNPN